MKYNKNCKICNKEFVTTYSNKITCGYDCSEELRRNRNKKYQIENKKYHKEYKTEENKI